MDPTQPPLNITPQVTGTSPYTSPNSPYGLSSIVAALKGGAQGGAGAAQQQAGGANAPAGQASAAPNFNQFGQQLGGGLVNTINALAGSSPSFGGGNILSGDAYGGSGAAPLPGLTAADYG
jgi:hypothetical protein